MARECLTQRQPRLQRRAALLGDTWELDLEARELAVIGRAYEADGLEHPPRAVGQAGLVHEQVERRATCSATAR